MFRKKQRDLGEGRENIMQDLKISIIQSALHWQSAEANLAMFEEKIWQIAEQTDVIVLPEMFNTGFTMEVQRCAEHPNGKTFRWMRQMAAQSNALIIGSQIVNDKGAFYNRLVWMEPDGTNFSYDKRHLFRMADEHRFFDMGTQRLIKNWKGWNICPLVCYDLRFPVWSRNTLLEGKPEYDLLIYIANWPEARITAWDTLLQARAIENLSYVTGVNRIGTDGKHIAYNGHSAVIDPKGNPIWLGEDESVIKTVVIERAPLEAYREKFPAFLDADKFKLD